MVSTLLPEVQEHFSRRFEEYKSYEQIDFKNIQGLQMNRVLEVGCGSRISFPLAPEKYGVDINPKLMRELHCRSPEVNLVIADVRFLPFQDGVFDLVTAIFLLHHLVGETISISRKNILKALNEMARLSNYRGYLLILDHLSKNKYLSKTLFFLSLILAKLNINLEYLDIHDKVVIYFLDENAIRELLNK